MVQLCDNYSEPVVKVVMGLVGEQVTSKMSSMRVMATKVAILLGFLSIVAGEGVLERLQKRAQYSEV